LHAWRPRWKCVENVIGEIGRAADAGCDPLVPEFLRQQSADFATVFNGFRPDSLIGRLFHGTVREWRTIG